MGKFLGKIQGIRVMHDNSEVKDYGFSVACTGFFNIPGKIFPRKAIVVDDEFMKKPTSVQKFILYHEIGHLKHHDTIKLGLRFKDNESAVKARNAGDPKLLAMELAADAFAAKHLGRSVAKNALKNAYKSHSFLERHFTPQGKEIKLRIKNI